MHVCVDRVQDKKPLFPSLMLHNQVYLVSEAYPQLVADDQKSGCCAAL